MLEREARKEGKPLPEPVVRPVDPHATATSDWREMFRGLYLKRTLMIWALWITVYVVNNGLVTWLPTLYRQAFKLPLETSLLYELIFPIGLLFAGLAGYFLVPLYGWRALFIVGLVPAVLMIPMRVLMPESPRWLASKGRIAKADKVVSMLEREARKEGKPLPEPVVQPVDSRATAKSDWREMFRGLYLKRTLMIWGLWITVYVINNGLVTWLPTLYRQVFKLPLETSLLYGWITSAVGVVASLLCALYIDKVGRKRWYTIAFLLATVPLVILTALGATTATQVVILAPIAYAILQTIAFSLYLYSAELYPTRLRAVGTGFGSAWLRAGSSIGPVMVGFIVAGVGIRYVFLAFAVIALVGGLVTARFGIETKGKVLEELSP